MESYTVADARQLISRANLAAAFAGMKPRARRGAFSAESAFAHGLEPLAQETVFKAQLFHGPIFHDRRHGFDAILVLREFHNTGFDTCFNLGCKPEIIIGGNPFLYRGLTFPATVRQSEMLPRTPELFIETWQKASSCPDAASKLGMTPHAAASRAWAYRKSGIPLKKFPQGKSKLRTKELSKLAKSFV